jgi:16S rRNA (cytosine967-C5)-methyltransferase
VDSAVRQAAARAETGGYKALVNAVLRRLAREGEALLGASDEARDNVPDWLWVSWQAAYGEATARAIARAHLTEPPLDLSFKGEAETWTGLGAVLLPTGTVRLSREARSAERMVEALPGFEEGAWWVQDAAAALPVRLLGDVTAKTVLDLCAAPGGKTAQLAAAGARVVAVDRAEARLDLLRRNLTRLRLSAETINADAATWRPETPAPAVLLDAPCSATGTIRRHPDVAWLKRPEDVTRMAAAQDRLLQAAVEMTAPGGVLVYCVCSLQPEEGPERIAALLAAGAPVERERIEPAEIGGLAELISPEGDLRTLPCHLAEQGGLDGFFAARLRRR